MRRLLVFGLQAGEIGGEIGYILVAKFGDDEIHHLVLALTSLVGLQTLYEVVLVLTADVRRVRDFADTIQPVAGLAFQGLLASCFTDRRLRPVPPTKRRRQETPPRKSDQFPS